MRNRNDILTKIKNIISSILEKSLADIDDEADLRGRLGMSSRETCETIVEVENMFNVSIEDQEIVNATTPDKLADIVLKKSNGDQE